MCQFMLVTIHHFRLFYFCQGYGCCSKGTVQHPTHLRLNFLIDTCNDRHAFHRDDFILTQLS